MTNITLSNGITLAYDDQGARDGLSIVLIHGISMSRRYFHRQIAPLSERHRVIAVDLRGHGDSDKVDFGHTVPRYARDVEDAFRRMVAAFTAQHEKGSPPGVVARVIARALATPRPRARYLAGKNSRRMAILAATLPTPMLDALRRRLTGQPAPGSRATSPRPAEAALSGSRSS